MGVFLDTQNLKNHPSGHPNILGSKFFHLSIIPMTLCKDLIPNFNE